MKLLFVDDSPTVCAIYSALLKGAGYEVWVARGKSEGVELARQYRPQIAIIDFFMPDGNGDELTRALHADPVTAHIVVAIHSQFPDVVSRALEAGAVELIGKEDPHDLFLMRVAALRKLVEGLSFQRDIIRSVHHEQHRQEEQALRVLLVDDSATIRAVYGTLLRESGYEVLEADSLALAEEVAYAQLPQLMIIDYMLPDGHGDELVRRLVRDPKTSDILMVMFSQRQDVKEAVLKAGAVDLIYKDDPKEIFLSRIASLERYIRAQMIQRRIEQEVMVQENEMQLRLHDLEQVKQEKRFVDQLISSIPVGLLVVSEGRVITANRCFADLFGQVAEEGSSFEALMETLQLPLSVDEFTGDLGNDKELRLHNGQVLKVHHVEIHSVESYQEKITLWLFDDVTQLRHLEEQEQFAAFQSGLIEMSSTILHNIGNALMGVNNALWQMEEESGKLKKVVKAMEIVASLVKQKVAEIQEHQQTDEEMERADKILQVSVNHILPGVVKRVADEVLRPMTVSINHISEVIRVQRSAAKPEAQHVRCDVNKLVDDVLIMQEAVLQRAGIAIHREMSAEIGELLLPRNQLLQAINNLIKNGFEAIFELQKQGGKRDGKIMVSTRLEAVGEGGGVIFTVEDDGIGLTDEQREKIFSFGFTTKQEGSGFGLHATANFIESMGGEVKIESAGPEKGCRVSLFIPITES
ncbi:MAG: response regulator [Gammaproteobacteria bacterium]|jgi:CheY-like chemotaxis protein|nr:response regulator [Gammaproteobacteria bacterium]MBT3490559.1 response regulator [Gammaproteobacteria bacterium]MBT3717412.1 response regulator [Gammaproteobacteria bacterium]MBT3844454.1 response regulator [Gammaproteobacteria bacterium]MBT3893238.1 response regulator [Gammaproteobacteria bacterium]